MPDRLRVGRSLWAKSSILTEQIAQKVSRYAELTSGPEGGLPPSMIWLCSHPPRHVNGEEVISAARTFPWSALWALLAPLYDRKLGLKPEISSPFFGDILDLDIELTKFHGFNY